MQILSRDTLATEFDFDMVKLTEPLKSLDDKVSLRMYTKYLESFFSELKWADVLKS